MCQLGLMFFPEPRRGLEEFRRVLRPGGRVVHLGLSESGRRAVREEVRGGMAPFRSGDRLVLEAEALIGRGVRGPCEDG